MKRRWVAPEIRDEIVHFIEDKVAKTAYNRLELLAMIGVRPSRYYEWKKRLGQFNRHNGKIPKSHWILPKERETILKYCKDKLEEGYRRLAFMMLDEDVAAVSPSKSRAAAKSPTTTATRTSLRTRTTSRHPLTNRRSSRAAAATAAASSARSRLAAKPRKRC